MQWRATYLDGRVGVTDGASVVGDNEGNALGAELHLLDLKELVGGLLSGDAVDGEAALDVVKETEVLSGLLDGDDVCRRTLVSSQSLRQRNQN